MGRAKEVTADHVIIAVGSKATQLPFSPFVWAADHHEPRGD